ncbi:MAG: DR2241 family protein [Verrucomicrobiia bacterium]|jgi:hypothetical protein
MLTAACESFLARLDQETVLGQTRIRRTGSSLEIRHIDDQETDASQLEQLSLAGLCEWVQTTQEGHYRPLKSAPTLRPGWRFTANSDEAFEAAFQQLYPGAIPDLHAILGGTATPTSYREYTDRQTGMYRIATKLDDDEVENVVKACCDPRFCLKERRWEISPDAACDAATDRIPCLEPCAILLELARKAVRIEQEAKLDSGFSKSELESIQTALHSASTQIVEREAEFGNARNPRRNALLKLKVDSLLTKLRDRPEP